MADETRAAFGIYPSSGRRPERLNQSRDVNAPLQLLRGWAAGLLGLPGDVEGMVRMLPGIKNETPVLPTSDFYREYLPGYDPRPAARAMSGLAAMAGGAGATNVVRGGLGAVKRATDVNAIRDYIRATQGMTGLPGTAVVKPKGGNWIAGAGSPEQAVQGLKATTVAGQTPAQRIPYHEQLFLDPSLNADQLDRVRYQLDLTRGEAAVDNWLDQKLAKYIRNEMGTPEDPVRTLIEQRGVSHLPLEQLREGAGWIPEDVARARKQAGYPELGMVEDKAGRLYGDLTDLQRAASGWETAADTLIRGERAGDLMRLGENSPTIRDNPWLAKVPPETPVYSSSGLGEADLGFSHLVDELRNATRAGSDLPRELQLRPDQLSKVSMPQAVELVDRINKWRAAQKAEADLARSTNAAVFTHKEYPEAGYKWVEIKTPSNETMPLEERKALIARLRAEGGNPETWPREQLEAALKYEGEVMGHCVGGYCPDVMEGRSRIFSLRDAKGQPHVTVEVKPGEMRGGQTVEQYLSQPPDIIQIKGKANRAPKEEYLPFVQDFVKSQQWGRVGDLNNTGLIPFSQESDLARRLRAAGKEPPQFVTKQEEAEFLKQYYPEAGYARGGLVSAYDPARIEEMAAQLEEEMYA